MTITDVFNSWITFMLLVAIAFALLFFTRVEKLKKRRK